MTFPLARALRLALLVGSLSSTSLLATAQDNTAPPPPDQTQGPPPGGPRGDGPRGGNPERRIEMMQHQLDLTPDQTTQVRAIFADGRSKMEALRADNSVTPRERRPQMMALMQAESLKVRAVLTPDQQKKYDEMQARMRERRDDRGGPAGSGPPPPQGGDNPPPSPQQ